LLREEPHLLGEDAPDDEVVAVETELPALPDEVVVTAAGRVADEPHLLEDPVADARIVAVEAEGDGFAIEQLVFHFAREQCFELGCARRRAVAPRPLVLDLRHAGGIDHDRSARRSTAVLRETPPDEVGREQGQATEREVEDRLPEQPERAPATVQVCMRGRHGCSASTRASCAAS
jgi:hypothetical protein